MVVTIGVDAHKQVHAAVALDDAGREVSRWRGPNSPQGWHDLHRWAAAMDGLRQWGIERAWNYGRGLAQYLVAEGEAVFEVNPRWTAIGRRSARKPGKSDPLDARAVALLVWREASTLPQVAAEDETAVLDLLVSEREGALAEANRLRNQIHQVLLQVDPQYKERLPNLQTKAALPALESYAAPTGGALNAERAASVRRLAQRLRLALAQAEDLTKQIEARAAAGFSPLRASVGSACFQRVPWPRSSAPASGGGVMRSWLPMRA